MEDLKIEEDEQNLKGDIINSLSDNNICTDSQPQKIPPQINSSKEKKHSQKLENIPNCIKQYLEENNLTLVTFKNVEPIQTIKAAYLEKTNHIRAKDFTFQFEEKTDYYFFITKEENPNYLKPIQEKIEKGMRNRRNLSLEKKEEDIENLDSSHSEKIENSKINLNFDYDKYILKAVVCKKSQKEKFQIFRTEILNREICQVSHCTTESIIYYKSTKIIKPDKAKKKFDTFDLMAEKYYLIEIESKKKPNETILKEDGILSVLYLITPSKKQTIDLFIMVKYSLYFIKETLRNYIGKYIRDMIYEFCHLPSESLDDFLSHIGCLTHTFSKNSKIDFPLQRYIKSMKVISNKNLINHMYRNLPNISRPKAADKVPFHKFIYMYEKYIQFYAVKEFKIKQKIVNDKKYTFLKPSIIYDPINDKITKEHRINLEILLKTYLEILEKFFRENLSTDKNIIRNFMINNLSKFLVQYASFKGFFNLDVVINEDNVFEFQCSKNAKINNKINQNMFGCVVCCLAFINMIFGFNEGFFHKHFSLMDYSYNFNEKNVIHTFLTCNDSSKKNKIRIFDIPFMEKWTYEIAGLIIMIYRDEFGFLANKNYIKNQKISIDFHKNFTTLFDEIVTNIENDVTHYYQDVLPDFYNFCEKISTSPLDKYNCLDNLCQNFANNSLKALIQNNVIFFTPFDIIFNINEDNILNQPNLNTILEPYLILVDDKLKTYLDKKEKKDQYLEETQMKMETYYNQLKYVNIEKNHYSIFLNSNNNNDIEEDDNENEIEKNNIDNDNQNIITTNEEKSENKITFNNSVDNENDTESESSDVEEIFPKKMHRINLIEVSRKKIPKEIFNFYYLFDLYYNFTYATMKEMKFAFVDYDIIKRYIASIESSVTITFLDLDKTIIREAGRDNVDKIRKAKKNTKKNIIKDLIILNKLTRRTKYMNFIFCDYVKKIIYDVINDKSSFVAQKNANDEMYYIKIGHYIINFLAYEKNGTFFNTFEYFKNSRIYEKLNDESIYLDALGKLE